MGAPTRASPHLCRLLLPVAVFLLLLYLTSPQLPGRLPSACVWGRRPCRWFGEMPPDKEDQETVRAKPGGGIRPTEATAALLPAVAKQLPPAETTTGALLLLLPTPPAPQWSGSKEFQIKRLWGAFAASVTPNSQILIWEYLQGWSELIKLMDVLGAAFRLISAEAETKIGVLQRLRAGRHGRHYETLQAMVAFEEGPGGAPPSGCRTLLRLHRALRWLGLFLRGLAEDGDEAPAQLCAQAYREALAPFHAWWVRRLAGLAFRALPARPELLRLACGGAGPGARDTLRATVRTLERVYNVTQGVYAAHGLLGLP